MFAGDWLWLATYFRGIYKSSFETAHTGQILPCFQVNWGELWWMPLCESVGVKYTWVYEDIKCFSTTVIHGKWCVQGKKVFFFQRSIVLDSKIQKSWEYLLKKWRNCLWDTISVPTNQRECCFTKILGKQSECTKIRQVVQMIWYLAFYPMK